MHVLKRPKKKALILHRQTMPSALTKAEKNLLQYYCNIKKKE